MNIFEKIKKMIFSFRDERDWKQFHNPKDLAEAIMIESWELLEHFLWKSQQQSKEIVIHKKEYTEDELADIFSYLILFADSTWIDIFSAVIKKIEKNKKKYPIEKSKGNSNKYNEF